jgi:hypothetical protein
LGVLVGGLTSWADQARGLSALGLSAGLAVSAVLLFRIVSFWLPILPGWILWTQMQKRGLL